MGNGLTTLWLISRLKATATSQPPTPPSATALSWSPLVLVPSSLPCEGSPQLLSWRCSTIPCWFLFILPISLWRVHSFYSLQKQTCNLEWPSLSWWLSDNTVRSMERTALSPWLTPHSGSYWKWIKSQKFFERNVTNKRQNWQDTQNSATNQIMQLHWVKLRYFFCKKLSIVLKDCDPQERVGNMLPI